jgi:hypothetical protein
MTVCVYRLVAYLLPPSYTERAPPRCPYTSCRTRPHLACPPHPHHLRRLSDRRKRRPALQRTRVRAKQRRHKCSGRYSTLWETSWVDTVDKQGLSPVHRRERALGPQGCCSRSSCCVAVECAATRPSAMTDCDAQEVGPQAAAALSLQLAWAGWASSAPRPYRHHPHRRLRCPPTVASPADTCTLFS